MKHIISEEILKEASLLLGPDSSFHKILMQGLDISKLGLTPVYIYYDDVGALEVTTEEKVNNKLN
jgi:hypothetical protein